MKAKTQIGIGLLVAGFLLILLLSCLILIVLRHGVRELFGPNVLPVVLFLIIPIVLSSCYIVSIRRSDSLTAIFLNRFWLLLGIAIGVVRVFVLFFFRYYSGFGDSLFVGVLGTIFVFFLIFVLPYALLWIGIKGLEKKIDMDNQKKLEEIASTYREQNKAEVNINNET